MTPAEFIDEWIDSNAPAIAASGIAVVRADNWGHLAQGSWVELEGPRAWGRITVWPEGSAEFEIVDVETRDTVFASRADDVRLGGVNEWSLALLSANA